MKGAEEGLPRSQITQGGRCAGEELTVPDLASNQRPVLGPVHVGVKGDLKVLQGRRETARRQRVRITGTQQKGSQQGAALRLVWEHI